MPRIFIAVLVALTLPTIARSQPLADRIPADALVYIGWQGSQSMPDAYAASHLKAVLDASHLDALFSDFAPRLINQLGKGNPQVAPTVQLISSLGAPLWHHPTAIYSSGVTINAGGPQVKGGILCQAGDDSPALLTLLQTLTTAKPLPVPLKAFKSGDLVVLSFGFDKEPEVLPANSLATNPRFRQALSQVQKDPLFITFVDAEAAIAQIDQAIVKLAPPPEAADWTRIRDALGLPGLHRLIFTAGFEGPDWSTQAFIAAPAPRKGLVALLDAKPISDPTFKLIPQSAFAAGVEGLDLPAIFDLIRNFPVEGNGRDTFDIGIAAAGQTLGFDIRKDLIDAIGDEWAYYFSPVGINGSFVLANRLAKPAEAERALNQLELVAKKNLPPQILAMFSLAQKQAGQLTIHTITSPQGELAWTISDGTLFFANSEPALTDAIAPKAKTILDNPDFLALRKNLGGAQSVSFTYADLPQTAEMIYPNLIQMAEMGLAMARQAGVDPPANPLPTFALLKPHLKPSAAFSWLDDAGWHSRGQSPFPGSNLLAPNGALITIGVTSLSISILLPALNGARERANRVKCASNLKQIGHACIIYANDNKKHPPDLGQLVKDGMHVRVFICPSGNNDIPAEVAGAGLDACAKWVVEHADYVYLGASVNPNADADQILAYENPADHDQQGMNILFNDGHVEWLQMAPAAKIIKKQQPDAKLP